MTDNVPTKACIKCNEVLPDTSEYFRTSYGKTRGTCRPCHRKNLKKWRKANPEKFAAQQRRGYHRNMRSRRSFEELFKTLQESVPYYNYQFKRAYDTLKEQGFFDEVR